MVEQLLAAGADVTAASNDGSTPSSIANDYGEYGVVAMLAAAKKRVQRMRSIAFAMGLQDRLGGASVVRGFDPEVLRMVIEFVYPPVDNVLEAEGEGEINSDSDSM